MNSEHGEIQYTCLNGKATMKPRSRYNRRHSLVSEEVRKHWCDDITQVKQYGKAFDWGKTSEAYAKYRDIYPKEFYAKLAELSLGVKGQNVLDIALVLKYNPAWTGGKMTRYELRRTKVKIIDIVGENYLGSWDETRTACRGIVIDGEHMLLSYETKTNQWMIPGGGVEDNESDEECCIREIAEETGIEVEPLRFLLEIDEYTMKIGNGLISILSAKQ